MTDLLALTEELCAVPSESRSERALADRLETRFAALGRLAVDRVGDNIVLRSELGRDRRVVFGGHLDTVPANGNAVPRRDGDTLHALGAADMKGGVAIMSVLAEAMDVRPADARFDATFVFYVAEEIAEEWNGLRDLFARVPEMVAGDLAVLLEPTDGWVEAGCQGTLTLRATYRGARAHTARPWMGENAIHRAAAAFSRVAAGDPGPAEVDGLEYRQALQAVRMEGGVATNVVPDECSITVNRRFAPSVDVETAEAETRALVVDADEIEVLNASIAAPPNLWDPLVAELVGKHVRPRGAAEAGVDRRRPVRRARRPGPELRSRRSDDRPHGR